jgi:hypothetical protein
MVCVTLLLMASSFMGLQLHNIIKEIQARKAIKAIESHLQLCQKSSLLQQCDMFFSLKQEGDRLICTMGYDGGQGIYKNTKPLKQTFTNIYFTFPGKDKKVDFCFSSTGTIHPQGKLTLTGYKGKVQHSTLLSNRYVIHCNPSPIHPFDAKDFIEKN